MISRRRSTDDEDDLSIFFGPLPLPVAQPEAETLDELGRVPNANPVVARRERRSTRLARRSRRTENSGTENEEGYSTDSSLPSSDAADFNTAMQNILADRKAILSDVRAAEFKDPSRGIGKWFGEWRSRFRSTYSGAWGGLGVVGAWEFWARLEIMGWNPLDVGYYFLSGSSIPRLTWCVKKDPRNLASFSWYSSLQEYSLPSPEDVEDPKSESDGDLVSAMISTAIIPRLCKIIAGGALDPYSAKGIQRMVEVTTEVEASLGADNAKVQVSGTVLLNIC
jgi:GC-rich sequence DNA-binding factor